MNTKNNQRYLETEQRIMTVFSDLLATRDLKAITVRDICDAAHINRSSFYLHFLDIYDLMQKMEYQLASYAGQIFSHASESYDLGERFVRYFEFIQEHRDFFRAYLNNRQEMHVLDGTVDDGATQSFYRLIGLLDYADERELQYHQAFFKAGLTAMVREWLNTGCQESAEKLATILWREYQPGKFQAFSSEKMHTE